MMNKTAYTIPQRYLDMYNTFDKGHSPSHREAVRAFARELAAKYAPKDADLVDMAAALHDVGISVNREKHEEEGRRMLEQDEEIRKQLTKARMKKLLEAVAEHRKSTGRPRSIVARIVSDADKAAEVGPGHVRRAVEWGRVYTPELTEEQNLSRSLAHVQTKFGPDSNELKLFFPESKARLQERMKPVMDISPDDVEAIRRLTEASMDKAAASIGKLLPKDRLQRLRNMLASGLKTTRRTADWARKPVAELGDPSPIASAFYNAGNLVRHTSRGTYRHPLGALIMNTLTSPVPPGFGVAEWATANPQLPGKMARFSARKMKTVFEGVQRIGKKRQ